MTLLSEVIKEEIFLQEAERRELKVSKEEIESEVEELLDGMSRDLGRGDAAAGRIKLADLYEKQGLTLNDVREELRKKMVDALEQHPALERLIQDACVSGLIPIPNLDGYKKALLSTKRKIEAKGSIIIVTK